MTYKVAVTGVGGGSGQGILKALLQSPIPMDIYAIDVQPMSAGLFWPGVTPVLLPKPEEDIDAWLRWAASNQIDLIIPGADRDLMPLAEVRDAWKHITRIAVSSPFMVHTADDKAATVKLLENLHLEAPTSFVSQSKERKVEDFAGYLGSFPIVVKPRYGAASRGVQVCQNESDLRFHWAHTEAPIVQEYLDGYEYTCSIFFDIDSKPCAKFVMQRWLRCGDTYRAEVVNDTRIDTFLDTFADRLNEANYHPFGPINVQLKNTPDRGPVIFEINARCSGTTAIRAHFGYNEPEMLVRHILMRETITQPPTSSGFVFRHLEERYLDGISYSDIMTKESEHA